MSGFIDPPQAAAWRHEGARQGFEVAYFHARPDGWMVRGCTTAVESDHAWVVDYDLHLDDRWCTRRAEVRGRSLGGDRSVRLTSPETGRWLVDGSSVDELDGCLDVDLESSALTNALPVRRLDMGAGEQVKAPAVYVRALDLGVERLEQTYRRAEEAEGAGAAFEYRAPGFGFSCRITYDRSGLVLDYPGIASRAG